MFCASPACWPLLEPMCLLVCLLWCVEVLLNELHSPSVTDDSYLVTIMSCCHVLVTSSTLGLSLTTKFEHMVGHCIICIMAKLYIVGGWRWYFRIVCHLQVLI